MSLRFAILTSLTEREGSGIELARRFDRSIGYFWPATHQQIYRELDRLASAGLIRELKPGAIAGFGGYPSLPGLWAAAAAWVSKSFKASLAVVSGEAAGR